MLLSLCWLLTPSPRLLVLATAFVPFAIVGYAVAGVCAWSFRSRASGGFWVAGTVVLVVSLLGVVGHGALLAPSYVGERASGPPDLVVVSANLRMGSADPAETTRRVVGADADVAVLQEVTPAFFEKLDDLRAELPHVAGRAFVGARGTVVLSRYPLSDVFQLAVFQGAWVMRVAAPTPFWLVAVHTTQPGVIDLWRSDFRALVASAEAAAGAGPFVMAGDFNATADHRPMRDLLGTGLSDAARQARSGWQPTWPGDRDVKHGLPFDVGVAAIDHVLVSHELAAVSTSTHLLEGSDHRLLVARLAWR